MADESKIKDIEKQIEDQAKGKKPAENIKQDDSTSKTSELDERTSKVARF